MLAGGVEDGIVVNAVNRRIYAGDDALVAGIGKGGENTFHAAPGHRAALQKAVGQIGQIYTKAFLFQ